MRTAAVLPVKSFGRAKSRTALEPEPRAALVEAMVADVLDALAETGGLDETIVVTREPRAIAAAHAVGALVIDDPAEDGHSRAAMRGTAEAVARGAERVLLVPGDCPGLDAAELDTLLAGAQAGVTVIPDRHGSGTNALLLDPPGAIEPSFGPGSFARHCALARAAGAAVHVVEVPSLAFDVDTPEDLAALLTMTPPTRRTRAVLGSRLSV
ncbi:MAG: 2-phospho-L-lactate/phosphoenolpyruvate guanylyltransferase [Solirubrobacteraceae bacterium]|jgi:2-phospho-L-lactate guanylyltransferase|nr:2-phospho-L-lactate/phosphoenolpyruvate guanylyltransferase [Solirubrobacteraceae bacterium]